ncbi:TetR/AcrR family transcriptional regulator [Nesterenkonia ebinurensis]|uniref:TetR/AcrR family transcriptional regulator n=1 Tax=Nesterenkonia ebinurensis TaxID=2608252 RepID=UPI00123D804F|nr:TetR/AcrR family transcriptional regulator [Nesterenkonia ebinurensis]
MALTAAEIVETAHQLVGDYGLQDVSMRRVAKELDVAPGALYYHVPSKQELLHRVAHRMLEPLREAQAAPMVLMHRLREAVLPVRDGADLVLIAYALDPQLPPVQALQSALASTGYDAAAAQATAGQLMRYALGALAVEQNAQLFGTAGENAEELYAAGLRKLLGCELSSTSQLYPPGVSFKPK